MLEKLNDIELALKNESYLSALALALTLPDICGAIEYPEFKDKKGKRFSKRQYIAWFNSWVEHYYADTNGWTEDYTKATNPIFTGQMCYDLRCSYLHAGNSDIELNYTNEDDDFVYSYEFELSIGGVDSVSTSWPHQVDNDTKTMKTVSVRIDIEKLCQTMCIAAKRYFESKDSTLFQDHKINIIDTNSLPLKRIR